MNMIPVIREALGLQENEEFNFKLGETISYTKYRFTDNDIEFLNLEGLWEQCLVSPLDNIIYGECEVVKLPFKPKEYETYYFVNLHFGTVEGSAFSKDFTADVIRVNSGNCYRTREEAEKHVDEWMSKVYGKDWRELLK